MPQYNYVCNVCGHAYGESRDIDDPQFKMKCVVAGCEGTNVEVK